MKGTFQSNFSTNTHKHPKMKFYVYQFAFIGCISKNTQRRNIVCEFRSHWQNHKTRCHYKIAQRYCCHIPQTMHSCLLHRKSRVVQCRWINNHFHFHVKNLSNPSLNCQFTFHIVCHTYMGLTHCKA